MNVKNYIFYPSCAVFSHKYAPALTISVDILESNAATTSVNSYDAD